MRDDEKSTGMATNAKKKKQKAERLVTERQETVVCDASSNVICESRIEETDRDGIWTLCF